MSAFMTVFGLRVPTVFDIDGAITREFGIHHSPFGLFYSANGTLMRKGSVVDIDSMNDLVIGGINLNIHSRQVSSRQASTRRTY